MWHGLPGVELSVEKVGTGGEGELSGGKSWDRRRSEIQWREKLGPEEKWNSVEGRVGTGGEVKFIGGKSWDRRRSEIQWREELGPEEK